MLRATAKFPMRSVLSATLLCGVPAISSAGAQKTSTTGTAVVPGPIPAPILNAKTVFIANAADDSTPGVLKYTGGPDVIYNEFYAAVQASGRFQVVESPAAADLVLEINFKGNGVIPAELELHIIDVKTHVLLWTIREQIPGVFLTKTIKKNIKLTLDRIVDDMSGLYDATAR